MREVSQSHAALFEKIPAVQDLQCAWLLLLFCASTRANYLLRAVPPALSEGFARVHDTRVWECFSELLGVQAEGAPRNIAHLPFRHGGLGLASAVLSRSAACWASWADCLPMVKARHPVIARELLHALDDQGGGIHINSASSSRDQLIGMGFLAPTWVDVANGVRPRRDDDWEDVPRSSAQGWQHEAVSIVHDRLAESIWPGLTDSQRVLLRSQGGHMASSPFTTLPASFHARFDPQLFRVLLLRRLWQPLPPVSCICWCGRPLDSSACATMSGVFGRGRVCSRKCCRQSVQRSGRARLVQRLCAGFGCGCANRGRWETLGSGDRWPSTLSWRSVGFGCHHGVCIVVRWKPTQACSGRGWGSPVSSSTEGRTYPELTGRFGRARLVVLACEVGGRWSEETNNFFCSLQRPKFAEFPNH